MAIFSGLDEVQKGAVVVDFRGDEWAFVRGSQGHITVVKPGESSPRAFEREFNLSVFPGLEFKRTQADDDADAAREIHRKYGPFRCKVVGRKVLLRRAAEPQAWEEIEIYADEFDRLATCLEDALEALETAIQDGEDD